MLISNGSLVTKSPTVIWQGDTARYFGSWDQSYGVRSSSYAELYKRQLWVYVVVAKRARGVARLPLKVYLRDDLNRPEAHEHPYAQLLRNPNPGLSPFRFWEWTASTYDVFGEAFWLKVRDNGGRPYQLVPLHPTSMSHEDDGSWTFDNGSSRTANIPASELVHFKTYNPGDASRGLSPLEPLRDTLENEGNARTATSSFWRNGARPGVALSHPGNLSQPAAERLKAQWDNIAAGAGKTGSTVVLEEGMEPKILTLSAEEAQYIETRKLNREEVCGAYDVPPPVVHILDRATFSNITEQMRSMYRDTMAPLLKGFESDMDAQLRAPDFGDEVYAEFLLDEVLRGDFEARAAAYASADYMTIAEKRKSENLPYVEGTDRIFINAANQPMTPPPSETDGREPSPIFAYDLEYGITTIDERRAQLGLPPLPNGEGAHAPTPPSVVTAAASDPSVDPAAAQAARSVLGRLAWQKSLAEVDPVALTAGLNGHAGAVLSALAEATDAGETVADLRTRIKNLTRE